MRIIPYRGCAFPLLCRKKVKMKWSEAHIKDYYAGFALLVATVLSFIGTFLPPQGEVHQTMLYLIAQFLLLCATLLGFGNIYNKISRKIDSISREEKDHRRKDDEDVLA